MILNTKCCPKCKIYNKHTGGFDFCCRTCNSSGGQFHVNGCEKIKCNTVSTTCCPKCTMYKKYSNGSVNYDFCCTTCRNTNGMNHGSGCQLYRFQLKMEII